jgi:signal peptidase II
MVLLLFYWVALIVFAADQISKLFVRLLMNVGETHTVKQGILQFIYLQNSGAAGSTFQGYGRWFGILAAIIVIGIIYYREAMLKGRPRVLDFGLGMLAAGAAGNGIERLVYGKVTDFIAFGSGRGSMNLADLAINIGVLIIIVYSLFFSKQWKQKHTIS